ncbi:MAG TPA: GNAT family protein [Solirubrobacterales bacterium]|nr:GNAT family protein [Solirubrobacterales bacterium]
MRFDLGADLELRSLRTEDARELYAVVEANRDHLSRWMPWAPGQTLSGTEVFIRSAIRQERDHEGFQLALVDRGEICGVTGFHRVDHENNTTSVGYWLAADRQGRGLMTRAVGVLVDYAFDELGLHRIELRAAPGNAPSRALAERLGFTAEGLLREAERFGREYRDLILYARLVGDRG